tara:strand:- start:255 stop:641 length:387 start_codon:yes stop_codon:yes gene_type:complete
MRKLLTTILVLASTFTYSQSTLNFVKQFQVNANEYIVSNENYDTQISTNNSNLITISAKIKANVSEKILNQLFKVGRYNIIIKDGEILLDRIKKIVFINGVQLEENVMLNIQIPDGVILINNTNTKLL